MKFLLKILSFFLLILMIVLSISIVDPTLFGLSFMEIFLKCVYLLVLIIAPLVSIAVSSLTLTTGDNKKYFPRIICFVSLVHILICALFVFIPFEDISIDVYNVLSSCLDVLTYISLYFVVLSLICAVNPNNIFSNIFKKMVYVAMIINLVASLWLYIKGEMASTLPNVAGYEGFNWISISKSQMIVNYINIISWIFMIGGIIVSYISNFAFEQDVFEASSYEYDELVEKANNLMNGTSDARVIYAQKEQELIDSQAPVYAPTDTGTMNINNQLTAESNVGQITSNNIQNNSSYVEVTNIPTSSGPVINSNFNNENSNQNTNNNSQ